MRRMKIFSALALICCLLVFVELAGAATVTTYIDPSAGCGSNDGSVGNPYCSCAEWEAAEQTNLVTAGDSHVATYTGTAADSATCTIAGWTTDSTHTITLTTASASRHAGVWSASKVRMAVTNDIVSLTISQNYTTIDSLQILVGATDDNNHKGIKINGATNVTLRNNIIKMDVATQASFGNNAHAIFTGTDADGPHYIINNLIYDFSTGSGSGAIYTENYMSGLAYVYHNTIDGSTYGTLDGFSEVVAKNNLITNTTTATSGSHHANSDYNVTDAASVVGSNSKTSQTITYTNIGSEDYHTQDTDAQVNNNLSADAGYAVSDDGADGDSRPGSGAVYAGFDEYVTGGGAAWQFVNDMSGMMSGGL